MNREVLYRGKQVHNGEWVEGYSLETENPVYRAFIISSIDIDVHSCGMDILDSKIFEVIPETISEYTGIKDKSGKRIFEGDILADFETGNNYVVEYDNKTACFQLNNIDDSKNDSFCGWDILDCWNLDIFNGDTFELDIIGNIHDNPDLMEVR